LGFDVTFHNRKTQSKEVIVKVKADTPAEIFAFCQYIASGYKVTSQSALKPNKDEPGYHVFVNAEPKQ
jgi:hypothetical protein